MPERSKVIFNGTTLIDLTEDTVTPETLAFGVTAHSASGDIITGTAYKNTYYVKGTQLQATNSWTGSLSEVSALYNGLSIDYWLPYESTGNVTLNLTLKDNTPTGAVNVYAFGTTRMSTQVEPNSIVRLVYQTVIIDGTSYTGWWGSQVYDSGRLTLENSTFTGQINYHRIGKTVQVNAHNITLASSLSAGSSRSLGVIPAGFRPESYMYPASVQEGSEEIGTGFNMKAYNTGSEYVTPYIVEIYPTGQIYIYATVRTVSTFDNISISVMYFTD